MPNGRSIIFLTPICPPFWTVFHVCQSVTSPVILPCLWTLWLFVLKPREKKNAPLGWRCNSFVFLWGGMLSFFPLLPSDELHPSVPHPSIRWCHRSALRTGIITLDYLKRISRRAVRFCCRCYNLGLGRSSPFFHPPHPSLFNWRHKQCRRYRCSRVNTDDILPHSGENLIQDWSCSFPICQVHYLRYGCWNNARVAMLSNRRVIPFLPLMQMWIWTDEDTWWHIPATRFVHSSDYICLTRVCIFFF